MSNFKELTYIPEQNPPMVGQPQAHIEHYGSNSCDDWQFWLMFLAVLLISLVLFWNHYQKNQM